MAQKTILIPGPTRPVNPDRLYGDVKQIVDVAWKKGRTTTIGFELLPTLQVQGGYTSNEAGLYDINFAKVARGVNDVNSIDQNSLNFQVYGLAFKGHTREFPVFDAALDFMRQTLSVEKAREQLEELGDLGPESEYQKALELLGGYNSVDEAANAVIRKKAGVMKKHMDFMVKGAKQNGAGVIVLDKILARYLTKSDPNSFEEKDISWSVLRMK